MCREAVLSYDSTVAVTSRAKLQWTNLWKKKQGKHDNQISLHKNMFSFFVETEEKLLCTDYLACLFPLAVIVCILV